MVQTFAQNKNACHRKAKTIQYDSRDQHKLKRDGVVSLV